MDDKTQGLDPPHPDDCRRFRYQSRVDQRRERLGRHGCGTFGHWSDLVLEIKSVNTIQMIAAGVGAALLLGGAISAFGGRLRIPAIGDEPINSDKPAPEGTADYVTLVMAASPDCSPAGQLDYLMAELTEAQVLRSEVNRKLPTVTT
jgi:hypothetical protein